MRPQTPKAPFPYHIEAVTFENKKAASIEFSGTLTIPKTKKKPKVVLLISGSGPQNRDEEMMEHKPFLIIADYLSKHDIAVLRYDKRGVGESEGVFAGATSIDFLNDVEAAINYLKKRNDIDTRQIGLIGHSEGGIIAAMAASNPENKINFVVSLAGPGIAGDQLILSQQKKIGALSGRSEKAIMYAHDLAKESFDLIKKIPEQTVLLEALEGLVKNAADEAPVELKEAYSAAAQQLFLKQFGDPWLQYFIKMDPQQYWKKTLCPVLALNGDKDTQVLSELNLPAIQNALEEAGNTKFKIEELKGLNHLFQHSETGVPMEYEKLEETFAAEVLDIMVTWIHQQK